MAEVNGEIISVGTELLLGQIVDTHAATMARILAECGIGCQRRQTVGDNFERAVEAIRQAMDRADIVITIGGLGPTLDDLTRPAVASALGDKLIREPEMERKLRALLAIRKLTWLDAIASQADRPESATFIENNAGTAPGLICEKGGKTVICLPGPRPEFDPMAAGPVTDYLARRGANRVIHSRVLRICGVGESWVEAKVNHLMDGNSPSVAPYAKTGEVHLRLTARADSVEGAESQIAPVERQIREILGSAVYATNETTLEDAVLRELIQRGQTVAVAESMTGGGLAHRLTAVPGSSEAFVGGVVTYSAESKERVLGLDPSIISDHGPVSRACAEAMADNVRTLFAANFGIGITGNAGPTSDVGDQPVGRVFLAVASSTGCRVDEHQYRSGREDVRNRAVQAALVALRDVILGKSQSDTP